MRHIKKFNESVEYDRIVNDIIEQANSVLSYLIDKGFIIISGGNGNFNEGNNQIDIRLKIYSSTREFKRFKWSDIKDEFIPFLIAMNYRPKFVSFKIDYRSYDCNGIAMDIEHLLDDEVDKKLEEHRNHMKLVDENNINEIFVRFDISKKR